MNQAEVESITLPLDDMDVIDIVNDANYIGNEQPSPLVSTVKLPPISPISRIRSDYDGNTGQKINESVYRYEVIRLIMEGYSYQEISVLLYEHFNFRISATVISAFKRNYFELYEETIDRWEKLRHQSIVARLAEESRAAARKAYEEVYEIQRSLALIEERIKLLKDSKGVSPPVEVAINQYVNTKARLLERQTKVTGQSGLENKLKDMIKTVMIAVQRTLIPYLQPDRKEEAFTLLDNDLRSIIEGIDRTIDTLNPKKY